RGVGRPLPGDEESCSANEQVLRVSLRRGVLLQVGPVLHLDAESYEDVVIDLEQDLRVGRGGCQKSRRNHERAEHRGSLYAICHSFCLPFSKLNAVEEQGASSGKTGGSMADKKEQGTK